MEVAEVYREVARRLDLTPEQLAAERSGDLHYKHETRFAKLELVHEGVVEPPDRSGRGVWALVSGQIREGLTAQEVPKEQYYEGTIQTTTVNRFERDANARLESIAHHGCFCQICGFNFEKAYGAIGRGVIHVHHLVPLSTIGEQYQVDPKKDLLPVCPNCHEMAHRREPPYKPEELRRMLRSAAQDGTKPFHREDSPRQAGSSLSCQTLNRNE